MNATDRRTRGDLLNALEAAEKLNAKLTMSLPDERQVQSVTDALRRCVDALDQLRKVERESARASSYDRQPVSPEVAWVVRSLCDRYGVPLGEVVTQCERGHIDDLSPQAVSLIQNGVIR